MISTKRQKIFHYDRSWLKQNRVSILLSFTVFLILLALLALIPKYSGEMLNPIGYPSNQSKEKTLEQMLALYQAELNHLKEIGGLRSERSALLEYFLNTHACEYDYVFIKNTHTPSVGHAGIAYSLSLLDGASYLYVILFPLLGTLCFNVLRSRHYLRMMLLHGAERKTLFDVRTAEVLAFDVALSLLLGSLSLSIAGKDLSVKVLFAYRDTFHSSSLFSILLCKSVALVLEGMLFYFISGYLGSKLDSPLLTCAIPVLLFLLCFLFATTDVPQWGYYGQVFGFQVLKASLTPFANIVFLPVFGWILESALVLLLNSVLIAILFFLMRSKIQKVPL